MCEFVTSRVLTSSPDSLSSVLFLLESLIPESTVSHNFIQDSLTFKYVPCIFKACWVLLYTATYSEWKEKLQSEFTSLLAAHSSTSLSSKSEPYQPLHARFSSISHIFLGRLHTPLGPRHPRNPQTHEVQNCITSKR